MPKSSTAMRTPSWRRAPRSSMTCASSSSTDSVISTMQARRRAGRWTPAPPARRARSSPLRTWRAETLTATPRSAVRERGDRRAGLAQHPAAELGDERGLLGQRDELDGGDVAEQGVPPAQQRLDGDGALQDDVDDGLEDQAQLARGPGRRRGRRAGRCGGPARDAGRRRSGAPSRGRRPARCAAPGRRGAAPRRCRRRRPAW